MEEILKELIAKFNAVKVEGASYRTYKDRELEDAFEKAEAFLKGDDKNTPAVQGDTDPKSSKSKGKK